MLTGVWAAGQPGALRIPAELCRGTPCSYGFAQEVHSQGYSQSRSRKFLWRLLKTAISSGWLLAWFSKFGELILVRSQLPSHCLWGS